MNKISQAEARRLKRRVEELEQFREAVWHWRGACNHMNVAQQLEQEAKADRLLALIDAQSAKGDGDA